MAPLMQFGNSLAQRAAYPMGYQPPFTAYPVGPSMPAPFQPGGPMMPGNPGGPGGGMVPVGTAPFTPHPVGPMQNPNPSTFQPFQPVGGPLQAPAQNALLARMAQVKQ